MWPIFRNVIYKQLITSRDRQLRADKLKNPVILVHWTLSVIILHFTNFFRTKNQAKIVAVTQPLQKYATERVWKCRIMDPVSDLLGVQFQNLELPEIHKTVNYTPITIPMEFLFFKSKLYSFILRRQITDDDIANIKEMYEFIRSEFDHLPSFRQFVYAYFEYVSFRIVMTQFFRKRSTEAVLLTISYDYYLQALIDACRRLNITTIEIQHGNIYSEHMGYVSLISGSLTAFQGVPDFISVYSKATKEIILENSKLYDPDMIIVGGSPYHTLVRNIVVEKSKEKNTEVIKCLITSQPVTRRKLLPKIRDLVKSNPNLVFHLKPHPRESNPLEFYRDLRDFSNFHLVSQASPFLIELMKYDIHITSTYSTTLIESLYLDIPSISIELKEIPKYDFIDEEKPLQNLKYISADQNLNSEVAEFINRIGYNSHLEKSNNAIFDMFYAKDSNALIKKLRSLVFNI